MVAHKGSLYLFGGEFTSPKQDRFHHYRDFWRFDLSTNEWDKLPVKGGPQGRSGHRMAVHKSKIILFGGFTDTGRDKVRLVGRMIDVVLNFFQFTPGATSMSEIGYTIFAQKRITESYN